MLFDTCVDTNAAVEGLFPLVTSSGIVTVQGSLVKIN